MDFSYSDNSSLFQFDTLCGTASNAEGWMALVFFLESMLEQRKIQLIGYNTLKVIVCVFAGFLYFRQTRGSKLGERYFDSKV